MPAATSGPNLPPATPARDSRRRQRRRVDAARLRVIWSFTTGALRGHEGQPLVVGGTMYVVTPYPNVLYAFDLTKEGYRFAGSTGRT